MMTMWYELQLRYIPYYEAHSFLTVCATTRLMKVCLKPRREIGSGFINSTG